MKAVLYAAKSTADERGSIATQLAEGRALAEEDGLEIAGEFSDEAASAYSGDRGSQLKMAWDLAERIASEDSECALVVQHSDRLARGDGVHATHVVEYALRANKSGVEVRSIQDPQTFSDLLYAVVMGQRNHEDSRRKSLAVKAGMERRAEKGMFSGPRPYGYEYAKDGTGLVIAPHEAEVVRRIYGEFVAGRSLTAIARQLHEDGAPTATGSKWRQSTVSGILNNPVYVGRFHFRGGTREGVHEPLLDEDVWERAEKLLAARPKRGRGRPPKGLHLFRGGMLRCECGEAMVPRTNGGYQMYYCNGRGKLGREHCDMPHLRRVDIDSAVYRYFEQVGLDTEATRRQIAEARTRKLAEVRALLADAELEAHRAEERLARVRRDYQNGKLEADDWAEQRVQLTEEMEAATAEAERLRDQEGEVASWGELKDVEAETVEQLAKIRRAIAGEVRDADGVDAVRAALQRSFECFVIHREVPERAHAELIGSTWIEPVLREQGIDGYADPLRPVLREPLVRADSGRETNNATGSRCGPTSRRRSTAWPPRRVGTGSRS